MSENAPIIVAARRTPIGVRGRSLASLEVADLAAAVVRATRDDAGALSGGPVEIADVVLGNCMGPGGNPARVAALQAGLGVQVPGSTVDRQCGSGLAAILDAANAVRLDGRTRIAGGAESASTAPARIRDGIAYRQAPFAPAGFGDPDMLAAAEALAIRDGLTRERQDAHAARSHTRAGAARDAGRFDAEIVPVGAVRRDDGIGVRPALLPRLEPLFPGGTVTPGSATRVSDGAAAVVIADHGHGLAIRAQAIVGCDPALPGIGAAPAVQAALDGLGLGAADIAAFEIVEAFAAQSLAVLSRLGIADDDPRVCADGGALALGHPWGASAAVAVVRLFSRLVRDPSPGALGVAAASVGGGLGIALVVEAV
ncbi:thiolase family protein [Microbacterium stercoris]|uniref:thiolase family protein n=1 Tax=Microbacterium stercoris TaxID=2820289 RepID=UPI001F3F8D50|nr:thiolase family protein [Microbacterium stercoris]